MPRRDPFEQHRFPKDVILLAVHRRSCVESKPLETSPSEIPCRSVDALH